MDPNGNREKAVDRFLKWKKEVMPSLIKEVEPGYLRQIRLLKQSYDPTQLETDRLSGEELDDMLKALISPLKSPKRVVKFKEDKQSDLEDVSSEELDYEDESNSSSSSSSSSASSSDSDSSSSSSNKSERQDRRRPKRRWRISKMSTTSDSDTDDDSGVPEKKKKLKDNSDTNKKSENDKIGEITKKTE